MDDELFEAYRRTTFSAETPLGSIHLRVEQRNEQLVQLLKRYAATGWAYITAYNPASLVLTPEENRQRQGQLEDSLRRECLTYFPGAGAGDDRQWLPEASVLVLSIHPSRAIELARKYGQNAILAGGVDGVPELLDCRQKERPE